MKDVFFCSTCFFRCICVCYSPPFYCLLLSLFLSLPLSTLDPLEKDKQKKQNLKRMKVKK